jgi:hypothetical protein
LQNEECKLQKSEWERRKPGSTLLGEKRVGRIEGSESTFLIRNEIAFRKRIPVCAKVPWKVYDQKERETSGFTSRHFDTVHCRQSYGIVAIRKTRLP